MDSINFSFSKNIFPDSPILKDEINSVKSERVNNINIRQALDRSRNIPAVKAMAINEQNNSGSTWSLIRAAGNKYYCTNGADAQAGLSSALGSCGTRLIDHVNAYSTLSR